MIMKFSIPRALASKWKGVGTRGRQCLTRLDGIKYDTAKVVDKAANSGDGDDYNAN